MYIFSISVFKDPTYQLHLALPMYMVRLDLNYVHYIKECNYFKYHRSAVQHKFSQSFWLIYAYQMHHVKNLTTFMLQENNIIF